MTNPTNAVEKPEPGCGCDFAGTGGEMCPEALVLGEACVEVYRQWIRIRHTLGSAAPESSEAEAAYDAAARAYRAHVEAAG